MNKKIVFAERNLEELLKNLSADKKSYPNELLKVRRASYLSQVTSVVGGGPHLKGGNGKGQSGSPPSAVAPMTPLMKAVLTLLVAANVALASYLAVSIHDNWDKLMGSLSGGSPIVVETSPADFEIPTQEPASATTSESPAPPEETIVPTETPEPTNPLNGPQPSEAAVTDGPQAGASGSEVGTPDPNDKDNPGNHLGQTPHGPDNPPGQTNQDNSQNNDQGSNQGNNQGNNQNNGQGNNKDNIP